MAYTPVGVGTVANDNTGDPIRTAFQSINANFVLLDTVAPDDATLNITGNDLLGTAVDTDVVITPNGTGVIVLDGISLPDSAAGDAAGAILESDGAGVLSFVAPSNVIVTATTAELDDIADAINTGAAKVQGYQVYNTTTDNPCWAVGAADGDIWVDGAGTTVHTPS